MLRTSTAAGSVVTSGRNKRLSETAKRVLEHHRMKTYVGVEVKVYVFLASVLDKCKLQASRPDHFIPDTRWTTGVRLPAGVGISFLATESRPSLGPTNSASYPVGIMGKAARA
jgi:hypothetical protein